MMYYVACKIRLWLHNYLFEWLGNVGTSNALTFIIKFVNHLIIISNVIWICKTYTFIDTYYNIGESYIQHRDQLYCRVNFVCLNRITLIFLMVVWFDACPYLSSPPLLFWFSFMTSPRLDISLIFVKLWFISLRYDMYVFCLLSKKKDLFFIARCNEFSGNATSIRGGSQGLSLWVTLVLFIVSCKVLDLGIP